MVILGRSCGNPHKHWRLLPQDRRRAGAELPPKGVLPGDMPGRPLPKETRGGISMAAGLTKTQLVRHMAEKLELTNKQVSAFFDLLTETAVKETKSEERRVGKECR